MPVDAIVRVSFQSNPYANQAVNSALVGHAQNRTGPGALTKVGTACYSVSGGHEVDVAQGLAGLGAALADYALELDFVSISLVRRDP